MRLAGKVVVVTGASGALGKAVVAEAEDQGASVFKLDVFFPEYQYDDNCHVVNLNNAAETKSVFGKIGPVDVLLNLAGGFGVGDAAYSESDEQWKAMFATNVETLRNAVKGVVPSMLKLGGGAIVNVGAYSALAGKGGASAYCASKNTVMRLTESLSDELKFRGINVNAVLPTVIDTPANRASMSDADPSLWVAPEKLATVICFLASDAAAAIHGALIPVRGLS